MNERVSFSDILGLLLDDFKTNLDKFENNQFNTFIEAMHRYSEDIHGYCNNKINPDLNADFLIWTVFISILRVTVIYE